MSGGQPGQGGGYGQQPYGKPAYGGAPQQGYGGGYGQQSYGKSPYTRAESDDLYPPWIEGQPPPGPPGQQQPPPGQQPPGQQPPPTGTPPNTPPGQTGTGLGTGGNPASGLPTPGSYPGGSRFWQMDQWLGVPYLQTYGGQQAPYDSLGSQILNTLRMGDAGAGRFNANAGARYGYQGGQQQWRPDANPWGQQIPGYQWNPQAPYQQWPRQPPPGQQPPPGAATPPPASTTPPPSTATPPPAAGPVDHTANFNALRAENPRLAYEYIQRNGDTIGWWNKNRSSIFGGDQDAMNQFSNQNNPQSSNAPALSPAEMRRLNQMAGIQQPMFDRIFGQG